jgi:DNA-binding transcriptional LysR family regulator
MATQDLAAGRLIRVLPEYQSALGSIYVMYPPAKPLPPKVTAFTTYVREHAPRLL